MPNRFPRRSIRVAAATVGLGLIVSLAATEPAAAQRTDRQATDDRAASDARPTDARPDRRTTDLEVLRLACAIADDQADITESDAAAEATRVRIGCRWRPAKSEKAAGYQLWRIVDRGEREAVARGGLDMLGARDVVPASAEVVRYAVIAVDENGRRVGQSRVQRVVITERDDHDRGQDRPAALALTVARRRSPPLALRPGVEPSPGSPLVSCADVAS